MKISPKQLEKAMAKLGMQAVPVEAHEVIIKTDQKDIVIKNPQVTKLTVSGQTSWQILGEVEERQTEPSEEDVSLVVSQTGASREQARQALIESGGDLAAAIIKLKKNER